MSAPLPPALLERLKRRGVIKDTSEKEEVFAENYDKEDEEREDDGRHRGGAPGCPNRNNQYHICSTFCFDHWQEGYSEKRF